MNDVLIFKKEKCQEYCREDANDKRARLGHNASYNSADVVPVDNSIEFAFDGF